MRNSELLKKRMDELLTPDLAVLGFKRKRKLWYEKVYTDDIFVVLDIGTNGYNTGDMKFFACPEIFSKKTSAKRYELELAVGNIEEVDWMISKDPARKFAAATCSMLSNIITNGDKSDFYASTVDEVVEAEKCLLEVIKLYAVPYLDKHSTEAKLVDSLLSGVSRMDVVWSLRSVLTLALASKDLQLAEETIDVFDRNPNNFYMEERIKDYLVEAKKKLVELQAKRS